MDVIEVEFDDGHDHIERAICLTKLQAAGCKFFPLKDNSKKPGTGGSWKEAAKSDFTGWTGNLGVMPPEDMVVIDIDSDEAFNRVRRVEGWTEATFSVKTPRGRHYYWKTTGNYRFQNFAGNNPILGEKVDLRVGGAGYVVAPYSTIYNRKYKVLSDSPIATMPDALEQILAKKDVVKIAAAEGSSGKHFSIEEGGRDNMLTRIVGFMFNTHASEEAIQAALHKFNTDFCKPPLPDQDIARIWKSIGSKRPAGTYEGVFVPSALSPAKTLQNCLDALGIELRHNLRSSMPEYRWGDKWENVDDFTEAHIDTEIREKCLTEPEITNQHGKIEGMVPLVIGNNNWSRAFADCVGRNQIDPFSDLYLDNLTPTQDTELLEGWLAQLLPLEQNEENLTLAKWGSRYLFLGAVQRTKQPGCKLDEMLILYGQQGVGKSSVCESVVPSEMREECFTDRLNLTSSQRELAESIQGVVIAEASEMTGMSKANIEKVKSLITTRKDRVRLAYRRNIENIERRCIFVGTTNTDSLPNDPTSNRRFIVVRTVGNRAHYKVEDWMDKHRDRLFAAALWEYENGGRANLPRELVKIQTKVNEENRIADELFETACEEAIDTFREIAETGKWKGAGDWLEDGTVSAHKSGGSVYVSLRDIGIVVAHKIQLTNAGQIAPSLMQYRIRQALLHAGWTPVRKALSGSIKRVWKLPDIETAEPSKSKIETPKYQVGDTIDGEEVPF